MDTATQLGPWSDIYALGATMYHEITDEKPGKKSLPLTQLAKSYPKFSRAFLASIDKAMHPEIKHRWSSVKEWLDLYQSMDQITRDANRLF